MASRVFHHLRGAVVLYPVLHQPLEKLPADIFIGITEEASFDDASHAVLFMEISELPAEHGIVGEDVVALGDGKSVAGSDKQSIGTGDDSCSFL